MAAHRADAHAGGIDGRGRIAKRRAAAKNFVDLGAALPLFKARAIATVGVDPWDQAAGQGHAEVFDGGAAQAALRRRDLTVDLQDGTGRVVEQRPNRRVERAHLRQQLAHVLRATATGGLVGGASHPLHQVGLEERAHAHEHAAHGAVAADVVLHAACQRVLDNRHVHRVEHDHRVVVHAQRFRRVDPSALPAGCAQLGVDGLGVLAALCGDDDVAALERRDVARIKQPRFVLRLRGRRATGVAGGKEHRLDERKVALGLHALHQHRADHAAPANQSYECHSDTSLLGPLR